MHTEFWFESQGNEPLGRQRMWVDNNNMGLREMGGTDWFRLAQENLWRAFVNMVMSLGVQ
jgi:hypothetical protein